MKNSFFSIIAALCVLPTGIVFAQTASVGAEYKNPLRFDKVDEVITSFLNAMQTTIVTLAIVFIVVGGVLYITSAGNTKMISMAKDAFFAAMIGLAIGIAAPTFLLEIYKILGANKTPEIVNTAPRLITILKNTLSFLLSISGVLALVAMVAGGITYTTAAGDSKQADTGKQIFKNAAIGVIIIMASLIIVRQIAGFFAGTTSDTKSQSTTSTSQTTASQPAQSAENTSSAVSGAGAAADTAAIPGNGNGTIVNAQGSVIFDSTMAN